mgnify:CR=1 FL=1
MLQWTKKSETVLEAEPTNTSRFVLQVKRSSGNWFAFVSEEEVDEGKAFNSLIEAQQAAQEAYDTYWADFETPIE